MFINLLSLDKLLLIKLAYSEGPIIIINFLLFGLLKMSLVADYGSDSNGSESSGDSENGVIKTEPKTEQEPEDEKPPPPLLKLPVPNFSGKPSAGDTEVQTSVFTNPFREAENAKEAILQKHVKMVDTKDVVVINGKKICWNYRKGRCRFGHNCKYAHDSDIQKTKEQLEAEKEAARSHSVVCQSGVTTSSALPQQPSVQDIEQIKEESVLDKKRKRPGLTPGLVPGKKVMKLYHNHKS